MKIKFNRVRKNEMDGFLEDFLFSLFSDYFNLSMDDNITYNTSSYSVKKSKVDKRYEYYDVYWLEIIIFEIKVDIDEGTQEIGHIKHKGHLIDFLKKNWELISNFQKEKMKNYLLGK
jgi:hypothetical protein